jgi:quinol monooxygenase YgiN
MAIHFLARWYPKPERLPEFLGILQRLAGSLPPDVAAGLEQMHTVLNRNGEFLAFEIWKDEQAMNRLRRSKLFHDAIREFSACCSARVRVPRHARWRWQRVQTLPGRQARSGALSRPGPDDTDLALALVAA